MVPGFKAAGCYATGFVASTGLGFLRCRLRGSTAGLSYAQPGASPHCAGLSRPQSAAVSLWVRCRLPSQGRWSANEHNAELCAAQKACCPLRRIISIMCKLPSPVFDPPPAKRGCRRAPSAPKGLPGEGTALCLGKGIYKHNLEHISKLE